MRLKTVFFLLVGVQALHSLEEYYFELYEVFPPARFLIGLVSQDLERGFVIINSSFFLFGLWCFWWPIRHNWRSSASFAWFWVCVELVNGIGHPTWSLLQQGYRPGLVTALVLLPLAVLLARELISERRLTMANVSSSRMTMNDRKISEDKNKNVVVSPAPAAAIGATYGPTVWLADNFSPQWFEDALHEAISGTDVNSIRREIIFSSCFLESYIFEWARNIDIGAINDYFPANPRLKDDPRYRRTLKKEWKEVPKELFEDGKIPVSPQLDVSGLGTLVKYRNGLVHATASRPTTDAQPPEEKPFPANDELSSLKYGWALSISIKLVEKLHSKLGTTAPEYLSKWKKKS